MSENRRSEDDGEHESSYLWGPHDILQTPLGKLVDNVVSVSFDPEHAAVSLP